MASLTACVSPSSDLELSSRSCRAEPVAFETASEADPESDSIFSDEATSEFVDDTSEEIERTCPLTLPTSEIAFASDESSRAA